MDGQNIFYHYTSINSLYNIIMSRELWLTNLKSSNDKSERYYTVNHMLKDMDEIINNSTDDNFKQYLSLLKKSFETHMPDLKNYLKKSDGYSLSLTDKKDNLSHWERYASSYSGVCIGINMDKLNVNFKDYSHFSITELEKILYSDAEILDKLSHICACFYDLFEEQIRNYNDPFQKYIEQYGFIVLVIAYNKVMNFAKNNYFADEHEFRLLFYPKTLSMKKDFLSMSRNIILPATLKPLHDKFHSLLRMSSIEQTHFSLFKNEIRSYHKLCLTDIWDSELIPEITLGGCETGEAKITKGYNLKAKYVIHTVGPIYSTQKNQASLLANCYKNSLDLALKHDIHSIAFPAISTGVYHYPLEEATKIAISTVKTWLDMHKDYKLNIIFSCFDEKTYNMYQRYLEA